jgi:hypothetical protein
MKIPIKKAKKLRKVTEQTGSGTRTRLVSKCLVLISATHLTLLDVCRSENLRMKHGRKELRRNFFSIRVVATGMQSPVRAEQ